MKGHPQSAPASSEQPQRDADVVRRPRELDDFPRVMLVKDMAEFFRYELKTFYRKASAGDFDFALIKPTVGRLEYDRERVRQHVDGTLRGLTVARKRA